MKRFLSVILSMVLLLSAIIPASASENTLIYDYGTVTITIPQTGDFLEDEFREFVKMVSDTYYYQGYNLNEYYYQAAKVKHEWDDGGLFWTRRDNPYSTYADNPNYSKYNIPVIQSMLIDGIQQKADALSTLDVEDYYVGLSANAITGDWENDVVGLLAQAQYDAMVDNAILQAENALAMSIGNALIDVGTAIATGGAVPDVVANVLDAATNVVADCMNACAEQKYKKLEAELNNAYVNCMTESVLAMYDNIDELLFEDYSQLYQELCQKASLSVDEKLLKEQLNYLLNTIREMRSATLSSADMSTLTQIAEDLVNSGGLEIMPVLTDSENTAIIVIQISKSLLINCCDAIISTLYPNMSLSKTVLKDMILGVVAAAFDGLSGVSLLDLNGDGVYNCSEILYSAFTTIVNRNVVQDIFSAISTNIAKKIAVNAIDLDKGLKQAAKELDSAFENLMSKLDSNSSSFERTTALLNYGVKYDSLEHIRTANEKIKDSINTNKMTGIGVLVKDIVGLVIDTYNLAKETAGLGDQIDNEVFFATIACSMYHKMLSAETLRASLNSEYYVLRLSNYISNAEIDYLIDFVNRVYSVYEMDMLGHADYVSLAIGWRYQTTEQMQDAMDAYAQFQQTLRDEFTVAGQAAVNLFYGFLYYQTYRAVGAAKSEYLKEVNNRYGWLNVDYAEDIYAAIAGYATTVRLPQKYLVLEQ